MKRHRRNRRALFIGLALALGLVAAAPFLTRPGLPRETDAELHVYRAAELGRVLRAGVFYPRWAPNFYFGYGYPIFNYYAPLTYYAANLFDLLPAVDIVGGVKAVIVLGFLLASVGGYLLGRDLFGDEGGILAALSFTFSPYILFIDPHARGALAEHFALCLLPLAFYAFGRLMRGVGGRWTFVGSVLSLSSVVMSHNLIGLVAAALLSFYWLWLVAFDKRQGRRMAGWGGLAFALSASVIAFFWLPFVFERGAIKLNVIGPGHFDFREHFLSLTELLAPSRILDMRATAPHHRFNLGIAQWVLALLGLGGMIRRCLLRREKGDTTASTAIHLLYFALTGGGLIFLMSPISRPIWERVPGMPYLQFPWRLLGVTNLMLSACAAGVVLLSPSPRWRAGASAIGLFLILATSLPLLYPPLWPPNFGGTSSLDFIRWEQNSLALGTTSTGDFLPVEAAQVPMAPMPSLITSYQTPGPVDRVNRDVLPDGAQVKIVSHGPLHDRFAISTPEPFILRLYTFYFPGWRAYLNDEETPIDVAGPEGFITVQIPEGEHDVLVRFEDTPPRTAGWIISGVGWMILVLSTFAFGVLNGDASGGSGSKEQLVGRSFLWLTGALIIFLSLKTVVIDRLDNWFRYTSPPGKAQAAEHELHVNFGNQIALLGYDLPKQRVRSGDRLPLTLYWQALSLMDVNYQTFIHLVCPAHILWAQEDHLNPAGFPTTRWPLDKYVRDSYSLHILPGVPPGEYALHVGVYSMHEGYRLPQYDGQERPMADSAAITTVEVLAPRRQPAVADLGLTKEVMTTFPDGGVTLLGYIQEQDQALMPGDWSVTLFWRADQDKPAAHTREIVLWDVEEDKPAPDVWRASGGAMGVYPFDVWRDGEVIRDPVRLTTSSVTSSVLDLDNSLDNLENGVYRFGVELRDSHGITLHPRSERPEDVHQSAALMLGYVEFVQTASESESE